MYLLHGIVIYRAIVTVNLIDILIYLSTLIYLNS